jgi:dolichol-phosphate mannosyltransferase
MFGFASMSLGIVIGFYLTVLKLFLAQDIGHRPLLILAMLLFLGGLQLLSFGLISELLMRTYHESQDRPIYRIREVVGGGDRRSESSKAID